MDGKRLNAVENCEWFRLVFVSFRHMPRQHKLSRQQKQLLVGWLSKVLRPTRHSLGHFGDDVFTETVAPCTAVVLELGELVTCLPSLLMLSDETLRSL